jgi:hypothetical protein
LHPTAHSIRTGQTDAHWGAHIARNCTLDLIHAIAIDGIVTVEDLRTLAIHSWEISRMIEHRQLYRVHRGVCAIAPPDTLSRKQRWLAAVRGAGAGAMLSHGAAAQHKDVWRWKPSDTIEIVSPERRRPFDDVRLRHSALLLPDDGNVVEHIHTTRLGRLVVDLGTRFNPYQLAWIYNEGAFRCGDEVAEVPGILDRHDGAPGIRAARDGWALYESGCAGTASGLEDWALSLLRGDGNMPDYVNVPMRTRLGVIRPDFRWRDTRVVVEVDHVSTHDRPPDQVRDQHRDEELAAMGFVVLRVRYEHLRYRSGEFLRAVRDAQALAT